MRRFPADRAHPRRLVSHPAGPRVFVTTLRKKELGRSGLRHPGHERLRHVALYTLARAAPQVVGDLTVVVTDDKAIRQLNQRFRDKDVATDVLAFALNDGLAAGEPFGDVVISIQTAKRQARKYGASLDDEMCRLLVHGTLHLCGHDHHERRAAARMHGLTRRLLRELAVAQTTGSRKEAPERLGRRPVHA